MFCSYLRFLISRRAHGAKSDLRTCGWGHDITNLTKYRSLQYQLFTFTYFTSVNVLHCHATAEVNVSFYHIPFDAVKTHHNLRTMASHLGWYASCAKTKERWANRCLWPFTSILSYDEKKSMFWSPIKISCIPRVYRICPNGPYPLLRVGLTVGKTKRT